jgi:hypothetical protein
MQSDQPTFAFLGICNRSQTVIDHPLLSSHNILGLRQTVACSFFPLPMDGTIFIFLARDGLKLDDATIQINLPGGDIITLSVTLTKGIPHPSIRSPHWALIACPAKTIPHVVTQPGQGQVILQCGEEKTTIGWLGFEHVPPPPLTPERINALRSTPMVWRMAKSEFECKECKSGIKFYASLDRSDDVEQQGFCWYQNLPLSFSCTCGKTVIDLGTIRNHFHAALEVVGHAAGDVAYTRLYERSALQAVCNQFADLLKLDPLEEEVQTFIKANPILLHPFAPNQVYYKPPILTHYKADIGILSQNKDLLLIELERPGLRLLNKDGGQCAELQKPLDQVRNWLHTCHQHSAAVLNGMGHGLYPQEVAKIRGVVICGRDDPYDPEFLRRLKWHQFPDGIQFFTYDDILRALVGLIRTFDSL